MRVGTVVSVIAHVGLIAWGVVSFAAPRPLDTREIEAIPVAMVKIDEVTSLPKLAPAAQLVPKPTPAPPAPTAMPAPAPSAAPVAQAKPVEELPPLPKPAPPAPAVVAKADAPAAVPTPAPSPKPTADPAPVTAAKPADPAPVPVAAPKPRIAPTAPTPAAKPAEKIEPFDIDKLTASLDKPKLVPAPAAKPAEKIEPLDIDKLTASLDKPKPAPAAAVAKPAAPAAEPFDIDKITSFLGKPTPPLPVPAKPAPAPAPAAKPDTLALNSLIATTTADSHMTVSEVDALRARIAQCWTPPPGWVDPAEVRVVMIITLNADGSVAGTPQVVQAPLGRYAQTAPESAVRAVRSCAPYALPAGKYQDWKEVKITFDPKAMATG